jgi:hypothetical protein
MLVLTDAAAEAVKSLTPASRPGLVRPAGPGRP